MTLARQGSYLMGFLSTPLLSAEVKILSLSKMRKSKTRTYKGALIRGRCLFERLKFVGHVTIGRYPYWSFLIPFNKVCIDVSINFRGGAYLREVLN